MLLLICAAPARSLARRSGALVLALVAFTACDPGTGSLGQSTLQVGDTTIDLGGSVKVHEVTLNLQSGGEFDPATLMAGTGDVLHFRTDDSRTHALAFDAASLLPPIQQVLADKQQLRSPPLVTKGTSWVVSLAGIPAGSYRINCVTHNHGFTVQIR